MVSPDSVARLVAAAVKSDGVIQESLRRRIVNHRALARWFINHHGWHANMDAIVSALRRVETGLGRSQSSTAHDALIAGHVNLRSGVALVRLSKSRETQDILPRLFQLVDYTKGEVLRIIQSEKAITIIVDEKNLAGVREALDAHLIEDSRAGVMEVDLVLRSEAGKPHYVLGTVVNELALRNVEILDMASSFPELLIFVPEQSGLDAYRALSDLMTPKSRGAVHGRIDPRKSQETSKRR